MIDLLAAVLRSGAPIAYAALAGALAQRAGIWHLGLEGLMIAGAAAGTIVTVQTSSSLAGLLAALVVTSLGGALFWLVIDPLKANTIIAGLGLSTLGLGATEFALEVIYGSPAAVRSPTGLPRLHGVIGGSFGQLSVLVAALPVVVAVVWFAACRTRLGLQLVAVGEHPLAANSAGISQPGMRLLALTTGGALCGLAGMELSLGGLAQFSPGITAGQGFIAFAAIIIGRSHPVGVVVAALGFGLAVYLGIWAQLQAGELLPRQFVLMAPYVLTIVAVWLTARYRSRSRAVTHG